MEEYIIYYLPRRPKAAAELLNELAAEGWRVRCVISNDRVIMYRTPVKEE